MFRAVRRLKPMTFLVAGVLAAAISPSLLWAAGGLPDDDADHASGLTVMADFNRDGIPDIAEAVAPAGDPSRPDVLKISLGRADGSFKQAVSIPLHGRSPRSIVVGDFNKDGIPDLIVGDDDGSLMLFLGDGTGKLVSADSIAHLDSVVSIVVADFNHDGIPDLAVSDWRSSSVKVLLGVGDGSFQSGWSFPLRMAGTMPHLSAADFNGDGIPDLAVVYDDEDGDTFDVMLGSGNGGFIHSLDLSVVRDANAHCVPESSLK